MFSTLYYCYTFIYKYFLDVCCRFVAAGKSKINPFPHIDAFRRLCSRRLFENIVTKEEIAQNMQFLLFPQCFPLFVIGYPFNYGDFLFFDSCLLQNCRMRERVKSYLDHLSSMGSIGITLYQLSVSFSSR